MYRSLHRHDALAAALLVLVTVALAASAPAGNGRAAAAAQADTSRQAADDPLIAHVVSRITYGARPGDLDRVRKIGVTAFIESQLAADALPDAGLANRLSKIRPDAERPERVRRAERARQEAAAGKAAARPGSRRTAPDTGTAGRAPAGEMASQAGPQQDVPAANMGPASLHALTEEKLLRAAYSERQLQEIMVEFWFNHFNVFAGKNIAQRFVPEYERSAIRPRVFGRFRDLLGATAESPAMMYYLDNRLNFAPKQKPAGKPAARAGARPRAEGMGMQSPGANPRRRPPNAAGPAGDMAAPMSTVRTRRALNENYARELLELHTLGVDGGYTQADVVGVARAFTGWTIAKPVDGFGFTFDETRHDDGDKTVLGHHLTGGGKRDGDQVLDIVARHPSTARFIATKLVRRFVADEPPAALVERAAARFTQTDGDIREVLRTILLSREFLSPQSFRAKVKTPLEFVVSAVRVTDAELADTQGVVRALVELGMRPYYCVPPTGYEDQASAWVNQSALMKRMNFALALAKNSVGGVRLDLQKMTGASAVAPVRKRMVSLILHDHASKATLATLERATTVPDVAALVLGSPEFQKR